ncbi:glycosyltransferase [Falsirhodobacter sp. 20TX0035]|uniref:glycosyltransferase n=1 Tax=Falsirhodobacter sp. 20TX0035 TaxID=3022019 RepID=UPI00232E1568|nr:glycosyltransferase [Falsirhodobacter sp. 20TX0035]MDB6454767.1 glycosyltransferase [Falsirhodobacter sp. 20TX0035]
MYQVLGLCRFSLLVEGGFQVEHENLDARRAMLYDPERLALRFVWFEEVCLPSLRRQTDPNFTLILLTGVDFPDWALARLREATRDIPQIVLHQIPPERHRPACRRVLRAAVDPAARAVLQFRLDDDDAVAFDFVERLRADLALAQGLMDRDGRLYLDYNRGFTLMTPPEGRQILAQVADRVAAGLAVAFRPGDGSCVMDFAHNKIHQVMNGLAFTDPYMYVRGKNGLNDSTGGQFRHGGVRLDMDAATCEAQLATRFGIDLARFDAATA